MNVKPMKLRLITYGCGDHFDPEKFLPITNGLPKPTGGLWASPVDSSFGWKDWCEGEQFRLGDLEESFEFDFDGMALMIDTLEHALEMPWVNLYGESIWMTDIEAIAKNGVDAIFVTQKGEIETRYHIPKNLYGWDCESVLILNKESIIR